MTMTMDEEYTTPRSSPMKPPPAPEEIEMSQLPREQKSKWQPSAAWVALKKMYPQANKDALEVFLCENAWRDNPSVVY